MLKIRRADDSDFDAIWEIFHEVMKAGDSYPFSPETTKEEAYDLWMAPHMLTYVAEDEGEIVGTYMLKPNQPGLGSHIANGSYMVRRDARGKGIGMALAEHSLVEAKKAGFIALQFNLVVSTNEAAKALWKKAGFEIIGTVPKAFNHKDLGLVDAHIMYKSLG